jgi:hypothetical protein
MDDELSRLYGLWYALPCEPTSWAKKGMGHKGVCLWITRESAVLQRKSSKKERETVSFCLMLSI